MVPGSHGNYARRSDNQAEERKEWMKEARVSGGRVKCSRLKQECHLVRIPQGRKGEVNGNYNSMVRHICVQHKVQLFVPVWS